MMIRFALSLLPAVLLSCGGAGDDLAELDQKYTRVMVDLAAAERDVARNVRNREARKRRVAAENARSKLFQSPETQSILAAAETAEEPEVLAKAAAYKRHALTASSWTEDEKKEETRLLGRLDELNGLEVSWTSPDGKTEISLNSGWRNASKEASDLSEADRADLSLHYQQHQMRVVGTDLQELVRLRNQVATRAGYPNYWALSLASQGLEPSEVDKLIKELTPVVQPIVQGFEKRIDEEATRSGLENTFANRFVLRQAVGLESGRENADDFFDTDLAEERVKTAFQDMGITTDGWEVYSGPTRYTRSGVYGFPVRPPETIAIVMSNDRRWTVWQYEALAHEGGHAVWWQAISREAALSPPMWEPNAPWFEGFAQFFERMVFESAFHARYVPEFPKEQRDALAAWRIRSTAQSVADSLIRTQVERRLYEDPTSLEAITAFAAQLRSNLSGKPPATELKNGLTYDGSLLSAILWTYPAYSQNFLFSAMTESWMWAAITAKVGDPIGNPKVGPLIHSSLVLGSAGTDLEQRLAALQPGNRSDALRTYLQGAALPQSE